MTTPTRVRAEIERLDADIVTLIEMSPAKKRILAELKARYPYQADCFRSRLLPARDPLQAADRGEHVARALAGAALSPGAARAAGGRAHGDGRAHLRFPHSRAQFRQATELAKVVEALPGPKLVMGDFNATPFSRILAVVENGANLRRVTFLPSWPATAGLPQIAIDHIFISPGLTLLEAARIGEAAGSDHYPVTARIAVPLSP